MDFFFITALLMTAVAILAVLVPLARKGSESTGNELGDVAVYKAQLEEIERDIERGVLVGAEAEAARVEASRRLLKAGDAEGVPMRKPSTAVRRVAAVAALLMIPLLAAGLYVRFGTPGMVDRPLESRLTAPADSSDMPALIARVERHLASNPNDARGGALLAPIYLRQGRADDAITALRAILRIEGRTPDRLADLGEALSVREEGMITGEASALFAEAISLDPDHYKSRYFQARGLTQEGRFFEALDAWRELARRSPQGAPWMGDVNTEIAALEARLPGADRTLTPQDGPIAGNVGPTRDQVEAAAGMSEDQRGQMIAQMVGRLAARLEANPDDLDGWERLVNAYMVMNRREDALAALERAREAFAGRDEALQRLSALAASHGLAP